MSTPHLVSEDTDSDEGPPAELDDEESPTTADMADETDRWVVLARKFEQLAERWAMGGCKVIIYRDAPQQDERGTQILGSVDTVYHPVDEEWFRQHYGGGEYHVHIKGPPKGHTRGGEVFLSRVYKLLVGGPPRISNGMINAADIQKADAAKKATDESLQVIHDLMRAEAEERKKAQHREQEARDKEQTMSTQLFREMIQSARSEADKSIGIMQTVLQAIASKDTTGPITQAQAMLDAARADFQRQVETLRAEADRERARINEDAKARETVLRDSYEKREKDIRDYADRREQSLRDEFERREKALHDDTRRGEKALEAQVGELKDKVRDLEAKLNESQREAQSARYDSIKAEMIAANTKSMHKPFVEQLSELAEMTRLIPGLGGSPEPDVISQVATILNTEPAKRVGAGLQAMLASAGQRMAQSPQAQVVTAEQAQLAQQAQTAALPQPQAAPQRVVRQPRPNPRPTRPEAVEAQPEAAAAAAQPGPVVVDDETKLQVSMIAEFLEASAEAQKEPATTLNELRTALGENAAMLDQLHGVDPNEILAGIEEVIGKPLTYACKALAREVLARI